MTPEGRVKLKIRRFLKSFEPDLYYEMPVPSGFGKAGLDFHCCYRGLYFAIEAKKPKGKPTARQELTIDAIRRAGGAVFVIDSAEGLAGLEHWLLYGGGSKSK
jgi:hypothetical protein